MIKILNSSLERQAILNNVINPNRFEELNGENTLTFSAILDEKTSTYIDENAVIELDDDYFDIACYKKNQNEDGTLTVDVETEHISYRLNEPDYDLDTFTSTGTPTAVLTALLSGTGFTVGTVSFSDSITYSAQEKKSRRMILMELVALLGGEVDFDKMTVSILQHRGSEDPKILTKGKNIKVVSKIYNKRERDANGNPLISYTCSPIMLPDTPLALGDEVLLIQKDLGIQEQLRIVRIGYNPYDPVEAEIELANFVSGLEDDIYRIQTTTVAKEKIYNGCRIGPDEGFVAERSDNKAKTVMNATEGISIYSDIGAGLVKNFFVGLDGRIIAKEIDIDGSGTFGGTITVGTNYKISINTDDNDGVIQLYDDSKNLKGVIAYNGTMVSMSAPTGTDIAIQSDTVYILGDQQVSGYIYAGLGLMYFYDPNGTAQIENDGTDFVFKAPTGIGIKLDAGSTNVTGSLTVGGNAVATQTWVSNNYSSNGHTHSYATASDISSAISAHVSAYHTP